jgi:hypothetical protein
MESKHTPGPWILNSEKSSVWSGDTIIAAITLKRPETEADARLIAAAPDLLNAAEKVLAGLNARIDASAGPCGKTPVFDGIADLHDAIAKARGQA